MEHDTIPVTVAGTALEIAVSSRTGFRDLALFLHGLGCSKETFRDVWGREDFRDLSLLALDLPGFGGSSRPREFSYSMEDQARACAEVLRRFSHERLHVVAHSMGGAAGLLLPDEVLEAAASFANIEGNLVSEDCGLISRKTIGVTLEEFESEYFPFFRRQFREEEGIRVFLDCSDPYAFYRSSESLVSWTDSGQLLERFRRLNCRKAYFHGERNAKLAALDRLAGVEKIAIARSGHFMMNDNPDGLYASLRAFLPL